MKISIIKQLQRIAPHLYRHKVNLTFYGMKKVKGRRIIRPLETEAGTATTDKATAFRLLGIWLTDLQAKAIDLKKANMTVGEFHGRARRAEKGHPRCGEKFRQADARDVRRASRWQGHGVARVQGRSLAHCRMAQHGLHGCHRPATMRNSTYNRYRLFISQMFKFVEMKGILAKSPFESKQIKRKGKQRVIRLVPSDDEFARIAAEIRKPTLMREFGVHIPPPLLRRVLDEAMEVACAIGFPNLFFPAVAGEKARFVAAALGDRRHEQTARLLQHAA